MWNTSYFFSDPIPTKTQAGITDTDVNTRGGSRCFLIKPCSAHGSTHVDDIIYIYSHYIYKSLRFNMRVDSRTGSEIFQDSSVHH